MIRSIKASYHSKASALMYLMFILFTLSCASDKEVLDVTRIEYDRDSKRPLVSYLLDSNDSESKNYNDQIRKTINYTKIPYQQLRLGEFNRAPEIPETTKVLILKNGKGISEIAMDSIITFVARGNTLVFMNMSEDDNFGFLSGVKRNSSFSVNTTARSYIFKEELIPAIKNTPYDNYIQHFGLQAENFLPTIDVLATAVNDPKFPVIIRHKIHKGQVISFNTYQGAEKQDRGLYFASILNGLEFVPYPIVNVGTVFLDDFPAPLYPSFLEPIKTELDLSQSAFYQDVWWPDMIKLATKYQLKYTAVPAFDYRGKKQPPFLFPEWDATVINRNGNKRSATDLLMESVLKEKHELGFHGYNHQSLLIKEWPDQEVMEIALRSAEKKWMASNFGELPVTYVPPSNDIDHAGIDALTIGMPSLRIMSSLYMGEFEDGGAREFDPEPYNDYFYDFPRLTSGFTLDDVAVFVHQSTFLYTGIWNHFLHPDDVYQIPQGENTASRGSYEFRNKEGYGWRNSADGSLGLLGRFEKYLIKTRVQYPSLTYKTTQDAVEITKAWRKSRVDFDSSREEIQVKSNWSDQEFWMTYIKNKNVPSFEKQLEEQEIKFTRTSIVDGFLYTLKSPKSKLAFQLSKNSVSKSLGGIKEKLLKEFADYKSGILIFDNINEEIAYHVANGDLDKVVELLKNKISTSNSYKEEDWLALKTYLGWQNKEYAIWSFLEKRYQITNDDQLISLSRKLTQNSDYPYLYIRKTWMERQMKLYPDDEKLQEDYANYFAEEIIKGLTPDKAILQLFTENDPSVKRTLLNYLMDNDVTKAHNYLSSQAACTDADLTPIADRIAWSYADKDLYQKALNWSKCSTIAASNIVEWRIQTGEFEFLKSSDYPAYVNYLLANNPQRALRELAYKTPCEDVDLTASSADIAYAFSNIGAYRKALEWSKCSIEIPQTDVLQWYYELGDYKKLEQEFLAYNATHPEDTAAIKLMIETYLAQSNYEKAFALTQQLNAIDKVDVLKRLNLAVIYATPEEKVIILDKYASDLDPKTRELLVKEVRLQNADTIESQSNMITDRLTPTGLNNQILYGTTDSKGNKHFYGITQTAAYSIAVNESDPANLDFQLIGARYGFATKELPKKFNYTVAGTVEYALNDETLFYELDAGASISIDSLYSSVQASFKPAITGPSYALNIYRGQISVYEELQLRNNFNLVATLEGNYYTDGAIDGLLLTKLGYNLKASTSSTFTPFVETAGMLGNTDQRSGFPYWTIKERFYGGGGISYKYNNLKTKVQADLSAAAFLDTFSDSFQRYGGSLSYPVSDYFTIKAGAEFYTLKNFYSNSFSLGLKYYLKD
ncbi:DUF2194 domain-containing protein [Nonlabens antarcticus]|uniref:DUF2194 domain-containing protein n=1 Tax=Nonlabens antarcticus TaxID=392714 RepID=UPI0018919928|nr:DUF2194 domain-containing protein [Nonlabens antarcticus]